MLFSIDLSRKGLTTLVGIEIPTSVHKLILDKNNFTDLTSIPSHIKNIIINDNPNLTSLNGCPDILTLEANNCSLTSTNHLPSSILECSLNNNEIVDTTNLLNCPNLRQIYINNNEITSLNDFIYIDRIYASNNNISILSVDLQATFLNIKNNPITSINASLPNLVLLNAVGTNINSFNFITNANYNLYKDGVVDYTTLTNVSQIYGNYENFDMSYNKNRNSYINIFYTNSGLHQQPPLFGTINTNTGWSEISFTSTKKDSFDFKLKNDKIIYLGLKKRKFQINNNIVLSGGVDYVQIVGCKNISDPSQINSNNSMIISSLIDDKSVSLSLFTTFTLNTGDFVNFYIRTGTVNVLTKYSYSLSISNLNVPC